MDILYLLIPLSAVLVLFIVAVFGWAVHHGQFDDLEREADRILTEGEAALDPDQARGHGPTQESSSRSTASM